MGISPSQESSHTKGYSSPKHPVPEQRPLVDNKDQSESEIFQTKCGDTSNAISRCVTGESMQPSLEDLTRGSLTEDLDSIAADICKSTSDDSSPKLAAINRKLEFVSECVLPGPSEGIVPVGSESVQNEGKRTDIAVSRCINKSDALRCLLKDAANLAEASTLPHGDVGKSGQIGKSSSPFETISGQTHDFPSDDKCCEPSEERKKRASELVENDLLNINPSFSNCSLDKHFEPPSELMAKSSPIEHLGVPLDNEVKILVTEQLKPHQGDMETCSSLGQLETPPKGAVNNSNRLGRRTNRTPNSKKKYMLRSSIGSDRALRSRSQDKPKATESTTNQANVTSTEEKTRKKKRRGKSVAANEYLRIKQHLRYLLNRMGYEQSLIVAYSGEGWKGLSLEKLKPEKELQRATSEILRCKLRIRDIFQRIDSLCAEGRLPETLFDEEGQISSEDIFCAKCGSKELTLDNDIILCDGACDRGFHQFCLVPPLLKQDIPPDEEGWLCPACDCKVDCTDLLSDSQGTNLSISDSWEKVFPEAAAAAAGRNVDNSSGLPSDDSDDNDYDPDGPEIDEKSDGDESSSDESDFTSASDELEEIPDKQHLGLSSDESEDDDYDPGAPDHDEKVKEESSGSDFTSDSEDLASVLHDSEILGEDQSPASLENNKDSNGRISKPGGKKNQLLKSELLSLLESGPKQDRSSPVSGKRNIERLDYKKLYDETYGNILSDSNDDEDYTDDTVGPRKRRRQAGEIASASSNGIASVPNNREDTEHTPRRRSNQKSIFEDKNSSPAKTCEASPVSSSGRKKVGLSSYRRLSEATTQGLHESFKENQYPDRAKKESLAKELGITFQQVTKWFENARWSFNHAPAMDAMIAKKSPEKDLKMLKTNERTPESGSNGAQMEETPKVEAAAALSYETPRTRSGKNKTEQLQSRNDIAERLPSSTKAQENQAGRRMSKRKSAGR